MTNAETPIIPENHSVRAAPFKIGGRDFDFQIKGGGGWKKSNIGGEGPKKINYGG